MSYDEEIEKTGIREHPLTAFQNMGSLSEGEDFATEFAELLDILSKNIVIPVELIDENADVFSDYEGGTKEDILKEWAAEHAKGERIYAEIDGNLQVAEVPVDPSGPDDVDVKGVGGVSDLDEEDIDPGDVLVMGDSGEIQAAKLPETSEPITFDADGSESYTVDVTDYVHPVEFSLGSSAGESSDGGAGQGINISGSVDLSTYDTLEFHIPEERFGYQNGSAGEEATWDPGVGDGGDGGGSAAIFDGGGNKLIEIGGGGGGGGDGRRDSFSSTNIRGGEGGDGGGSGNLGGDGGEEGVGSQSSGSGSSGGDGSMEINAEEINISEEVKHTNRTGIGSLFYSNI